MLCIIADDHPIYRSPIVSVFQKEFNDAKIIEADSLDGLYDVVGKKLKPDLILLDLNMPGVQGYSGLIFLQGIYPETPIIIVSANATEEIVLTSLEYGAKAFVSKSSSIETIIEKINMVLRGDECNSLENLSQTKVSDQDKDMVLKIKLLTPRQFQILMLVAKGYLNKQIADELFISLSTVKNQVSTILKTLCLSSRTHIAVVVKRLDVNEKDLF